MSSWRDPERWARWVRGDDCPICRSVAVDDALAELEVSRLMMSEDAPMRGYAWLPVRRHVVELHELTDTEGDAFMRDIRLVSRAIATATGAVKLNSARSDGLPLRSRRCGSRRLTTSCQG